LASNRLRFDEIDIRFDGVEKQFDDTQSQLNTSAGWIQQHLELVRKEVEISKAYVDARMTETKAPNMQFSSLTTKFLSLVILAIIPSVVLR
jgi:hypothetical protein